MSLNRIVTKDSLGLDIDDDVQFDSIGVGVAAPGVSGRISCDEQIWCHVSGNAWINVSTDDSGTAHFNFHTLGDGSTQLGTAGTKGWSFAARGDDVSFGAAANDLYIYSVDGTTFTTHAIFDANGGVLLPKTGVVNLLIQGNYSSIAVLDVDNANATTPVTAAFRHSGTAGGVNDWFCAFISSGGVIGIINSNGAGVVSYNAFSGGHWAWNDSPSPISDDAVVFLTGRNREANKYYEGMGGEPIFGVEIGSAYNDKRVLGLWHATPAGRMWQDGDPIEREVFTDRNGYRVESYTGAEHNSVTAVGVGGRCWVSPEGGDIEVGDLLVSSSVPGCAAKAPAVGRIHDFAKATQHVHWRPKDTTPVRIPVLLKGY